MGAKLDHAVRPFDHLDPRAGLGEIVALAHARGKGNEAATLHADESAAARSAASCSDTFAMVAMQ